MERNWLRNLIINGGEGWQKSAGPLEKKGAAGMEFMT
jgi:hypothetical protein